MEIRRSFILVKNRATSDNQILSTLGCLLQIKVDTSAFGKTLKKGEEPPHKVIIGNLLTSLMPAPSLPLTAIPPFVM